MGHWVTLADDQHVYISDGGKVLATRGKISSAAGGKDRGKALAARSRAAIGKATDLAAKATRAKAREAGAVKWAQKMLGGKMAEHVAGQKWTKGSPKQIAWAANLKASAYTAAVKDPTFYRGETSPRTILAVKRAADEMRDARKLIDERDRLGSMVLGAAGERLKLAKTKRAVLAAEHAKAAGPSLGSKGEYAALKVKHDAAQRKVMALGQRPQGAGPNEKRLMRENPGDSRFAGAAAREKASQSWQRKYIAAKKEETETANALYQAEPKHREAKIAQINRVGTRVENALKQAETIRKAKGGSRVSPREKVLSSRLSRIVRQIGI